MNMTWLKTQKAQNILLLGIAVLVLVGFANAYLSVKNDEEDYLMKKIA